MSTRSLKSLLWWSTAIVRLSSWIVPRPKRSAWREEQKRKVWHWCHFLAESGRLTQSSEMELLRYCWGLFSEALWLRFHREEASRLAREVPLKPAFTLAICFALFAVTLVGHPYRLFTNLYRSAPYADRDRLLTVAVDENFVWMSPEELRDSAEGVKRSTREFTDFAAYAWRPSNVRGPGGLEHIRSARVSPGSFTLLGIPPALGQTFDSATCVDCTVISDTLWESQFRRDPKVLGRQIALNSHTLTVIGVMPPSFRFPDREIAAFIPFATDARQLPRFEWPALVVHLAPDVKLAAAERRLPKLLSPNSDVRGQPHLEVRSLREREWRTIATCLGVIAFSLLLLFAFHWKKWRLMHATRPLGRPWESLRWYGFFSLKSGALLAAGLGGSLELVQALIGRTSAATPHLFAGPAALWVFLLVATVTMRWSIGDQLRRCRTCLRTLKTEVDLAHGARSILEQTGAELLCDRGHGVLHIPVNETGSVDQERWAYLDESWIGLLGSEPERSPLLRKD
jgi:hypothetical protein